MTLVGLYKSDPSGRAAVCVPHVGRYFASVRPGEIVTAGRKLGEARIAGTRRDVVAPDGCLGRVVSCEILGVGLGYGGEWMVLEQLDETASGGSGVQSQSFVGEEVRAPMDGQFYSRPSPSEPAFAPEGTVVTPGQTLGLIEVMKFFYPIRYEGSSSKKVLRCVANDASPVASGAVLYVLGALDSE